MINRVYLLMLMLIMMLLSLLTKKIKDSLIKFNLSLKTSSWS